MKVLITGAHFTPAQAVIQELLDNSELANQRIGELAKHTPHPRFARSARRAGPLPKGEGEKIQIVYVGRKTTREGDASPSVESQVLPKLGVKFVPIVAGRVRRYVSVGTFISLLKIPVGFVQAFIILLQEKPDVVVSFGGYVGVPVVFCAWLLNIPVILHEQTLVSGVANSVSQFFADKIAVSFDKDYSFSKSKIIVTGNPLRKGVLEVGGRKVEVGNEVGRMIDLAKKEGKSLVLVTGGNQGAHAINLAVEEVLDELVKKYFVVHQTGDSGFKDYERLAERSRKLDVGLRQGSGSVRNRRRYLVTKWIDVDDMGRLYREVDLAVSRCGANTLLELAYNQVPTLMIPLPSVSKDEQTINAKFFSKKGLGKILLQKELTGERMLGEIGEILGDHEYKEKARNAKEVVILNAEKKLAQEILMLPFKA